MEKLNVTAGLEVLLEATAWISCNYTVKESVVTFERELETEELLELELCGAEFNYLFV